MDFTQMILDVSHGWADWARHYDTMKVAVSSVTTGFIAAGVVTIYKSDFDNFSKKYGSALVPFLEFFSLV